MADLRLPDLRSLLIAGRLGNDPDLRYTPNGTATCKASLARDLYRGKDKDKDTLWLDLVAYGVAAETLSKAPKGAPVVVEGVLDQERWTGRDGQERTKIVVKANRVQRLDWDGESSAQATDPARSARRAPVDEPETADDLPF